MTTVSSANTSQSNKTPPEGDKPASACCGSETQSSCCAPSEKVECCESPKAKATGRCGCQ